MNTRATVILTLTGAKRYMIAGTTKTVLQWEQVRVDPKTADHLLDQYFIDKSNNEMPYFEEGVKERPAPRADNRRVRASQRRLDREKVKLDAKVAAHLAGEDGAPDDGEQYDSIRGDGTLHAQDPYGHRQQPIPDGLEPTNTQVVMETADDIKETRVIEEAVRRARPIIEDATPAKPKSKRKSKAKSKAKAKDEPAPRRQRKRAA